MSVESYNASTGTILMEPLKTIGPLKFVVISQGCVYCYKDEYAKAPKSAFSLSIYERAEALDVQHVLNCFKIMNEDTTKPPRMFACETNDKRKEWILQLNQAIRNVHYHSGGSRSGSDEGMSMLFKRTSKEQKCYQPTQYRPKEGGAVPSRRKNLVSEYDLESDEDDIDIDDGRALPKRNPNQRPKLALPDMSSANFVSELASKLSSASMGKPQPPSKPQRQQRPQIVPRPVKRLHPPIPDPPRQNAKEQENYENAHIRNHRGKGLKEIASNLSNEDSNFLFVWMIIYLLKLWGLTRFFITTYAPVRQLADNDSLRTFLAVLLNIRSYGASGQAFCNCVVFCGFDANIRDVHRGGSGGARISELTFENH